MKHSTTQPRKKRSIFRALFVPLFLIMILQSGIFYFVAVYGGLDRSLRQNAADILKERLSNRRNELEARFNGEWADLDACTGTLDALYADYTQRYGAFPFAAEPKSQIEFLDAAAETLKSALRHNKTSGIFLILSDRREPDSVLTDAMDCPYGICIRDLDPMSHYEESEDLLLERAPSSLARTIGCSLDSWWESRYAFSSREEGNYYYEPLLAAWEQPYAQSSDLAYFAGAHQLSASDQSVVSYSIPLISADGQPYGVLGVELTTKYLSSLLPYKELNDADKSCYVLTVHENGTDEYIPIVGTGALYSRCFDPASAFGGGDSSEIGGFYMTGRDDTMLYGDTADLGIYNNNSPFEHQELTLVAMVDSKQLFSYSQQVKATLWFVTVVCLALGLVGILLISRRFARPITSLASRVKSIQPQADFELGRLGIAEIDQLVDSIETLNRNVSNDRARTEFFSRMSHDMRTPMNAIISFSSAELLEGVPEPTKDDYLQKIHDSGTYLLGLINEVLDITKMDSNKTQLHYEAVRMGTIWATAIPIIEKLAQQRGVHFVRELSIEPQQYVSVDQQRLDQIVINLLSNAVKFTPSGGTVRLCIRMDEPMEEITPCTIVVSDTGIGMSEAFMEHLYQPFEQENSGREGTGLGLSIAKKLVELMGGNITCESIQHVGTTFTVHLGLKRCDPPADDVADNVAHASDAAVLRDKRVLVCEDHPINTQIACRLLQKMGIQVETAENGQIGVEKFAASAVGAWDAVLMDIRMPVMDGLAAAKAIRALPRADAGEVPIIAMTANAFAEDIHASRAAGMNAHLSKPIDPPKLYETLTELIGQRQSPPSA